MKTCGTERGSTGDDTRAYDKTWNLVRAMGEAGTGGVGVWIPAVQIVTIELYDPPPAV